MSHLLSKKGTKYVETEEEYDQVLNDKVGELTKGLPDFYSF